MIKRFFVIALLFLISIFITESNSQNRSTERILSFESDIIINKDASMIVVEKIKVHVQGIKIKRGIFRDFPTEYKDNYGNNYNVKFEILEILRDNKTENFHTENLSNGIRVYIGSKNYFPPKGEYTYTIKYKTNRQLGFFETFDELYWNVTGNGWDFQVEKAAATVHLLSNASRNELKALAFTGLQGKKGKNYISEIKSTSKVYFETTKKLYPNEGLTIVVQFPKGIVTEPGDAEKLGYFLEDNRSVLFGFAGVIIISLFYLIVWWRIGKDPKKGLVIPLYEPPGKLSPAAVRFISEMGYDDKIFTTVIISLAVKGYLKVEEDDKDYSLIKLNNGKKLLTADEKIVLSKLKFNSKNGKEVLELKQKNHSTLQKAIKGLKKSLKNSFEKTYFFTNRKYFFIGLSISILILIVSSIGGNEEQIFMVIWVTFWSIGVAALLFAVFKAWKGVLGKGRGKVVALGGAIFITVFAIPFVIGEIVGLFFLSQAGSPLNIVIIALLAVINITFYHLLKAPTLLGRKIMDKIEGFKMYLGVAEKDRLESIKEPTKTSDLFEKYLPFALALNVENTWAEKFSDVLENIEGEQKSYSPSWYSGAGWSTLGAAGFASSLSGSFSSTISSSSTAPGSSSGGSGGGFSGGGGGGGGGGGW
ncbi:MAG: DUF2207 domain-containing protein [Ignavibacteriaceae bacterium]|nr:DUF2207 domain-containing protein [Ignavibacteriaceae bacterium]